MRRKSDIRPVKKAMLLICEGTKTEPNFFAAFRDDKDRCKVEGEIIIQPKPSLAQEDIDVQVNRGSSIRKKRVLKSAADVLPPILCPGPQPLNWVNAGISNLDTFEEVWCVFDKDGHPTRKEAFELVEIQQQAGKNIRIAFSSRCIEFYFLLHFEYIYKAFEKSECNGKIDGKTRFFRCCLPDAIQGRACQGDCCTNGYARVKGYWQESKSDESLYPVLKDRLFFAIRNAELVRRESYQKEAPATPLYDRNPFVTTDILIARLLGYEVLHEGKIISIKEGSTVLSLSVMGHRVFVSNIGGVSYAIQKSFILQIDFMTGITIGPCGIITVLQPGQKCEIPLSGQDGDIFKINTFLQPYLFVL